ncbi:UDP-GlcNAc--UDP-phosphate GlcNAc-1-phosphate transferase [Larkinella humicola]|uniref:UDP-GlcNAc--UDP-phosphate GlcNAc-1-phosphate transferase n=1 Tax=Larkinella humicola TaxID=2607654 RepID=A0A5N1JAG6_9BACT|nr:UDP-GlcNAc--UDP-phosphate GlcNAc-1-phosphate transferase [Larkinella humicola]KAA9349471.1 UDP-GlcNAc--UDP-phosphate GlcNAc-1-phosphate transferase [Larkinella humicola]
MNWIVYAGVAILLLGAEVLYLRLATHYHIVDSPNHRSSHTQLTVRGGGIIFWLAAFLAFVVTNFVSPVFFVGLTLVALVSFLDDISSIPNRIRLLIQLISLGLLLEQTGLWSELSWWMVPGLILACGVLNAYNFMDGINGMTAFYSLVTVASVLIINQFIIPFTEPTLVVFSLIGVVIFAFFNARQQALCFAGDVGSVSMAFIVIFLLINLMRESGQLTYLLLLTVYGIDSVMTILYRLWRGENIFQPHKLHLFQLLVHQLQWPHLRVAGLYALTQFLINGYVIWLTRWDAQRQFWGSLALLAVLTLAYVLITNRLLKPRRKPDHGRETSQVFRRLT